MGKKKKEMSDAQAGETHMAAVAWELNQDLATSTFALRTKLRRFIPFS